MRREIACDGDGVFNVARHSQRQRLEALQKQERIERAHGRAEVSQGLGPQLHQIAVCTERFVELEPVICGRRIRDHRKSAVRPVELPRLDDRPTDARAMAADEFRRRMQDDVGAPFDRAAEVRRRERVVHDQREFVIVRDGRNRRDVEHVTGGVPDRLGEEGLGVIA